MKYAEKSNFEISVMCQDEIQIAIDWAKKEGWNPGVNDASAFYAADQTGFLVGKLDGAPIATISAVKYGSSFGFVGLYIVKEAFRGKGFGLKLWEEAMARLNGRNIGLDGVLAQQENYKKSGFKLAHRNVRFAGKSTNSNETGSNVVAAQDLDFNALENYDRQFFPAERSLFLKNWISHQNSHALAIIEDSRIVGYGCIRPCAQGFKIGPLNAESDELALRLFSALTNWVPAGSDVFLDVPEPNPKAVALAHQAGMSPVFETARMYTNDTPQMSLQKIFGITSFELG